MDVPALYRRATEEFGRRVHGVAAGQWGDQTPCTDWDVRALVNHLVNEASWIPPLFEGETIADVGDRFDGDLLGDDPVAAWDDAAAAAMATMEGEGAMEQMVELSSGPTPGQEYASQLITDHLIHGWDLARATGQDEKFDPELMAFVEQWFTPEVEDMYRKFGAIADRPDLSADADPQVRLLAAFGRTA